MRPRRHVDARKTAVEGAAVHPVHDHGPPTLSCEYDECPRRARPAQPGEKTQGHRAKRVLVRVPEIVSVAFAGIPVRFIAGP